MSGMHTVACIMASGVCSAYGKEAIYALTDSTHIGKQTISNHQLKTGAAGLLAPIQAQNTRHVRMTHLALTHCLIIIIFAYKVWVCLKNGARITDEICHV